MVEVDPTVLIIASTAVLGLAVMVVACGRGSSESSSHGAASASKAADSQISSVSSKKKSKKAAPKTKSTSESEPDESSSAAQTAQVTAAPAKKLPAAKVEAPVKEAAPAKQLAAAAPSNKEPVAPLPAAPLPTAPSTEPVSKKSKETAEQKAARMERQKLVKTPVDSADAARPVEPSVSAPTFSSTAPTAIAFAAPDSGMSGGDGWAVVGKVKAKKSRVDEVAHTADHPKGSSPPPLAVEQSRMLVSVDAKKIGSIIGPKGATLHAIQNLTDTVVNTPKDKDAVGLVEVEIVGATSEGVRKGMPRLPDCHAHSFSLSCSGCGGPR